jgi:hypothetical protein
MVATKIDRCVVDDALSDALGRQVTSSRPNHICH